MSSHHAGWLPTGLFGAWPRACTEEPPCTLAISLANRAQPWAAMRWKGSSPAMGRKGPSPMLVEARGCRLVQCLGDGADKGVETPGALSPGR